MANKEIRLPHNWKPRAYQLAAWTYLENGGRHSEWVFHRRAGKDEMALHWTAVSMAQRPGNYWHMLPKANQARKALWDAINPHSGKRRIDEAFPKELRTGYNDHEMQLKLGQSSWQVVGSDNFDALVGSPPIGLTFSEWALSDPSSWAYLRPVIAENKGWVIFNTTPRGKNHAYRTFKAAQRDPTAFAQILTAPETGVFTAEALEKERLDLIAEHGPDYGQAMFDQEYMCSFTAAILGAILGPAMTRAYAKNRMTSGLFDPLGQPIQISSDLGRTDASTWWFWQPRADGFAIVDYDRGTGLVAEDWCERLDERIKQKGYKLGRIWLPHDAKAQRFEARHSTIEQFINYFGAQKMAIVPDTKIKDRVNAARVVFEHCWFNEEECFEGLEGLSAWHYEYDEKIKDFSNDKPKHDWSSHDGDGFSYGALIMREHVAEVKEKEKKRGVFVTVPGMPQNRFDFGGATLDDLYATVQPKSTRI